MSSPNSDTRVTPVGLSIQRTRFANQRTYLAYMRSGFAIAAIAGSLKKMWIAGFGLIMIIGSFVQYYLINKSLNSHEDPKNEILDMIPMIYIFVSLGALYMQTFSKKVLTKTK